MRTVLFAIMLLCGLHEADATDPGTCWMFLFRGVAFYINYFVIALRPWIFKVYKTTTSHGFACIGTVEAKTITDKIVFELMCNARDLLCIPSFKFVWAYPRRTVIYDSIFSTTCFFAKEHTHWRTQVVFLCHIFFMIRWQHCCTDKRVFRLAYIFFTFYNTSAFQLSRKSRCTQKEHSHVSILSMEYLPPK